MHYNIKKNDLDKFKSELFGWNSNTGLKPTVETALHTLKYIKGIIGLFHSNMPNYHTLFLFLLVFEGNDAE